eukprot:11174609-Ditylum_brightwellii.AAC.1
MRALLRHSYEHLSATIPGFVWPHVAPKEDGKLGPKLRDTDRLPLDVPQPRWLADPMNRTKKGKRASIISMDDCLHLKKYLRYMLKQNPGKCVSEMMEAAKAPVDHPFEKYAYCGTWCKQKSLTSEEKEKQQKY